MNALAILAYHKIGEPPGGWYTWNYVSARNFEEHLQYLRDDQWNVIGKKELLQAIDDPASLPSRAALITFDDGYRNNLNVALPLLQSFSYPAIVFVPSAYVSGYNAFDADIYYEPKEDICTWNELRELERNNISIQSHGVNHRHMSQLTEEEQLLELNQSKEVLEANLQKEISIFSFPYGDNGGDNQKMAKMLSHAGYKAAVLYNGGVADVAQADKFALARVAVGADTDINAALCSVHQPVV